MKRTFPVVLTCLLLSAMSKSAQAEYFVMYEDLYPTTMMQARAVEREQPRTTPSNYPVQFPRGRSQLSSTALNTLYKLSRDTKGASIVIVGRPDIEDRNGNISTLARNRAAIIRDYLTRQGVAASSITTETEDAPNAERNSDVLLTYKESQSASPYLHADISARPTPALPVPIYAATKHTTPGKDSNRKFQTRAELLQLISTGIQSGAMRPTEAIELLRIASELDFSSAAKQVSQPSPASAVSHPPAIAAPIAQPVQAAPANPIETVKLESPKVQTPTITKWEILDSDVTLENTFARWSKLANWEVKWINIPEIKNQGYVELPGRDFLSVADYVLSKAKAAAKVAGIDISVTAYSNNVLVISKEIQK
jgi:Toxin co-regulated pilus biosynthesis protein Q